MAISEFPKDLWYRTVSRSHLAILFKGVKGFPMTLNWTEANKGANVSIVQPLEWAQRDGNVKVRYLHDYGGHFASWENPDRLAGDIRKFFGDEELSGTSIFRKRGYSQPDEEEVEPNLISRGWNWLRGLNEASEL